VKISRENVVGIEEYWYKQYKTDNPKLVYSLEKAYIAMQPHVSDLKRAFASAGVPTKYIYLAIPESHWNLEARSHAAAVGPYQFTKPTAEKFGLKIGRGIDERTDPLKSGQACAKYLKYLYDRTGDWDTALSGYNGSFIWKYLRKDIQEIFGKGYGEFLRYLEWNVNAVKEYILKADVWRHKARKGRSVEGIASFYGIRATNIRNIGKTVLKKIGGKWKHVFDKDQQIGIEIRNIENKKKVYNTIVRGVSENLNYPPKFNAVIRIIREPEFQERIQEMIEEEGEIMLARKR
jgi:hypothetical protein